jgi:N-acetylglucosaminyldiphosphoundecaprenol N-acetyl-beta-D-mannosaminyltransferase
MNIPSLPGKQPILGVGVSKTNYDEVAAICNSWVRERRNRPNNGSVTSGRYICVTSVHGIITAFWNPRFRATLNSADIATPDGMPVVWALRSFGARNQTRVYGPDLMTIVCEQAARKGHRVFLYGAREETLKALAANLRKRFPGIQIAGMIAPPFRPLSQEEMRENTRKILDSKADIVFVGLSTPKQETWMMENRQNLPGTVMLGVGAAFDFHAGNVPQAPAWMQQAGLEWLFRLSKEPKRLWRRYLLITPVFLPLWAMQKLHLLRFDEQPL